MKKIILIFSVLLLFFSCYAQNIQVSGLEYKTYIDNLLMQENNLKQKINNILNGIELNNDEFILLSGKLSPNKELMNYSIKVLKTSDDKANLIVKKLNESKLVFNYNPDTYNPKIIYDEFDLYIGAKPQYEVNKGFVISFNLTNEKLKQDYLSNKGNTQEYYIELYSKFYPEFIKIKKEFGIPDNKKLTIQISIDRNGNLLDYNILSSIDQKTDNYILSLIKKSLPFKKLPDSYEFPVFNLLFSFNDTVSNKVKENIKNIAAISKYSAIIKTIQNKRGDVISAEIIKSSRNNRIDEELLKAIKQTNIVEEYLKYDNEKRELYLSIQSNKIGEKWDFDITPLNSNDGRTVAYIDWNPCMTQVATQAKAHWQEYRSDTGYRIKVLILLKKDGQLLSKSIIQSSGVNEADNAVLKSIDDGIPYPKLPEEYKGDIIPIELTFDYNIARGGYYSDFARGGYYSDKPKSKYQELMQKTNQQQIPRPSINDTNSSQDFLLKLKEKSEKRKQQAAS